MAEEYQENHASERVKPEDQQTQAMALAASETNTIEQTVETNSDTPQNKQLNTDNQQASTEEPLEAEASTHPTYRPAPEYGAYSEEPVSSADSQATKTEPQVAPQQPMNTQLYPPMLISSQQPTMPTHAVPNAQNPSQPIGNQAFGNPYEGIRAQMHVQDTPPTMLPNSPQLIAMPATKRNGLPTIVVAIIASVVTALLCMTIMFAAISNGVITLPQSGSMSNLNSGHNGSGSAIVKGGAAPNWSAVAKQVFGSVVSIQTKTDNAMGKGSGAIVDARGYVVTNHHVVDGAKEIQVTLANGQMYSAQVIGADKTTDLAVLKIDNPPSDLKPVEFADSKLLTVGEPVMAIGNPLGYDDTATTGIVSALNRPVTVMDTKSRSEVVTNAIQIDAAINPGNSGGPTFNAAGKVIGVNSSIAATSSNKAAAGSIGIGFAIPSNLVKRVVNEIIKNGSVKHVAMGVMIKSVAVQSGDVTRGGAQVVSVNSGSPASRAGLQKGDVIVGFDGKPVANNYALLGYVRATALNDTAELTVVRNGKILKLTMKFDQEEATVNGTSRRERTPRLRRDNRSRRDNSESEQDGDDGADDAPNMRDGDDGGIRDPFGFW